MSAQSDLSGLDRPPAMRPIETAFAIGLLLLLVFSMRDSLPQAIAQKANIACGAKVSENQAIPAACSKIPGRHNS